MSYILDSLKKSEKERQPNVEAPAAVLPAAPVLLASSSQWPLVIVCLMSGIIVCVLVAWKFFLTTESNTVEVATNPVKAELKVELKTPVSVPSPSITIPPVFKPKKDEVSISEFDVPKAQEGLQIAQESMAAKELYHEAQRIPDKAVVNLYQSKEQAVPATNVVPIEESTKTIPLIFQLNRLTQQSIPAIDYGAHVYATDQSSGFVILNGAKRKVGEKLRSGIYIEQVNENEVVLSYQGLVFSLPAMKSWLP